VDENHLLQVTSANGKYAGYKWYIIKRWKQQLFMLSSKTSFNEKNSLRQMPQVLF